jgi:CHAT domain-containing protein
VDQAALALLRGNVDRAVRRLKEATLRTPEVPSLWNDLAAAHLAAPDDPQHLFAAWDAAARALELAPGLAEAHFNRAATLQHLFLQQEAVVAWEEYLRIDPSSPWASEGAIRRSELFKPSKEQQWRSEIAALHEAARNKDRVALFKIVSRHPQEARALGEEDLLGRWARAVRDGRVTDAEEALATARDIGEVLAGVSGDGLLLASVQTIEDTVEESKREDLLNGHLAYQEGVEGMAERKLEGVRVKLEEAHARLERVGSPLALWALIRLGHRSFLNGQPERALEQLGEVIRKIEGAPYKSLAGRAWWLTGTTFLYLARYSEALAAFRKAQGHFEEVREANNIAAVFTLLARTLDTLGASRAAWQHRLEALRRTAEVGSADRTRIAYGEAAWALLEEGRLVLAAAFQEESVRSARSLANPGHLATALRQRAAISHRLGEIDAALADLEGARARLPDIPDAASRENIRYEMAITEAQIRRTNDPVAARRAIEAALALGKDRFFVPSLLVERSHAHLALGDLIEAEEDLHHAIREIEAQRASIDEALKRASYLDQARTAYEDVVALQVLNGRSSETTLDSSERARARVLFDWISGLPSEIPSRQAALAESTNLQPAATLREALSTDTVAIEYMVLEDQTLAWVIRTRGVDLVILPLGARDLASRLAEWRRSLQGRDSLEEQRLASALHEILVRPLARFLHPDDVLVFLPDRFLHGVPFSALRDSATGHRLAQDRITSVAPSLNILATCIGTSRRRPLPAAPTLLVVAEPQFDRSLFGHLPELEWASYEAGETIALYPPSSSRLLAGRAATEMQLLAEVGRHEIFHYIGHAQFSKENPLLSSLILAPDPGIPNSGVLYAHELLGRPLENTKLVVLSACSTGVGPDSPTEGALSLATPFLAAGVPVVVASLWDVEDRSSANLMVSFHRHLRQGQTPAQALRSARLELLESDDSVLVRPQSWAAFEVICGR